MRSDTSLQKQKTKMMGKSIKSFDDDDNGDVAQNDHEVESWEESSVRSLQQQEVDYLPSGQCNLTTSLNSTEVSRGQRGADFSYYGVMFRVKARDNDIDILTIEFDSETGRRGGEADVGLPVEVYMKNGAFKKFYDKPVRWKLIVNTTAVPTPTSRGNIIPTKDFPPITVRRKTEKSFYIYIPTKMVPATQTQPPKVVASNEPVVPSAPMSTTETEIAATSTEAPSSAGNQTANGAATAMEMTNATVIAMETANTTITGNETTTVATNNTTGVRQLQQLVPDIYPAPLYVGNYDGVRIGDNYAQDQYITNTVGYAFKSPGVRFPSEKFDHRQFHGYIHYRTTVTCEEAMEEETDVHFPYYINVTNPPALIVSLAGDRISETIKNAMFLDSKFIRYENFNGLGIRGVQTAKQPMNPAAPCPFGWTECTKLISTVSLTHEESLMAAKLKSDVLNLHDRIHIDPDGFNDQFLIGYYGNIPVAVDYWITLDGVQSQQYMDDVMIQYFEESTVAFLEEYTQPNQYIFGVEVDHQILQGPSRTRRRSLQQLLQRRLFNQDSILDVDDDYNNNNTTSASSSRTLQTSFAEIRTKIYGAYTPSEVPKSPNSFRPVDIDTVRSTLSSAFEQYEEDYRLQLSRGVTQPGKVSQQGRYEYFSGITAVSARPIKNTLIAPTPPPLANETKPPHEMKHPVSKQQYQPAKFLGLMSYTTILVVAILLLVFGGLCCCCALMAHLSKFQDEKRKLGVAERRAQQKVDKFRREQARRDKKSGKNRNNQRRDQHDEPLIRKSNADII